MIINERRATNMELLFKRIIEHEKMTNTQHEEEEEGDGRRTGGEESSFFFVLFNEKKCVHLHFFPLVASIVWRRKRTTSDYQGKLPASHAEKIPPGLMNRSFSSSFLSFFID